MVAFYGTDVGQHELEELEQMFSRKLPWLDTDLLKAVRKCMITFFRLNDILKLAVLWIRQ